MNEYKILVCEDSQSEREDIQLFLNSIFRGSTEVRLNLKLVPFDKVKEELEKEHNLLILDLYDKDAPEEHKDKGVNVLMHNQELNRIPTVVYTSMGDTLGFDEDVMKKKYPCLIKKITKIHNTYENLAKFVRGFILSNQKGHEHYRLYNENDTSLSLSIRLIGSNNFSYILYRIYENFEKKTIVVYPMKSGLSGAVLFRLKISDRTFILKISTEIDALRKEHSNAIKLYHQFPNHLINHVDPEEYLSFDENVLGILIKNVDQAQTFFDFLSQVTTNHEMIETYLNSLYLDGNTLSDHFRKVRGNSNDWTAIFSRMDEWNLDRIEASLCEVKPIVQKYYGEIDIEEFRSVVIDNKYKQLSKSNLLDEKFKKTNVLSHGDFHSKNIMIQSGQRPVIIDTGLISYQHWSLDISRLIANIFTMGIDDNHISFFELDSIKSNIVIAEKILERKTITLDGRNDNVIAALNWLVKNVENIYSELFTTFEFQLGLMKEFLQLSYRVDTIPPGKRALAIIIAHKCLLKANENVSRPEN